MSHDDPNQGDGENEPHEEGPGPKAPKARPPGSTLDKTKLPRAERGPDQQRVEPRNGINRRNVIVAILAAAVVVCVVIVIVANPGGSKKSTVVNPPSTPSVSVSLAGTGSGEVSGSGIACPSTCAMTYSLETSVSLTASPASGSTFRGWGGDCSGNEPCNLVVGSPTTVTATFMKNPAHAEPAYPPTEFTLARGKGYNIDHLPPTREGGLGAPEVNGFALDITSAGHGYTTLVKVTGESGQGNVASWTGQGQPSLNDCKQAVEASGQRELHIQHQGEWFCAETDKHYIALIRYDGSQGEYYETFKIFAKVYRPGE